MMVLAQECCSFTTSPVYLLLVIKNKIYSMLFVFIHEPNY